MSIGRNISIQKYLGQSGTAGAKYLPILGFLGKSGRPTTSTGCLPTFSSRQGSFLVGIWSAHSLSGLQQKSVLIHDLRQAQLLHLAAFSGHSCVQIEAPEVSFPMAEASHQNSNSAKRYPSFSEDCSVSVQSNRCLISTSYNSLIRTRL